MHNHVNQIYHVSRCGSTLLTSLLSTVVESYSEPPDARYMSSTGNVNPAYIDKVVKFPSLSLIVPVLLEGPKVFLYRPLSQHLYKISNVEQLWLKMRTEQLKNQLNEDQIYWKPESDLDYIAFQWIASIKEISSHFNVLWIKTNDFLLEPRKTLNLVTEHFKLPNVMDFSYCNIHVKKLGINSKDMPCNKILENSIRTNKFELVPENYGVVSETNPYIDSIIDRVENLKLINP